MYGRRLSRNGPKYSFSLYDKERQKLLNLNLDAILVQHCRNNSEYSTRYFRHHRVVVSQRCTRHRLLPPPCADKNNVHCIHCYFCNAVLEYILPFYSPRGRPAKNQAQALRSLILFVLLFNKTPAKASLTAWVRYVLVGCTCTEELPPLGSYYDFMNRFWLALRNGYSRHSLFPKGRNSKKPDKRLGEDGKLEDGGTVSCKDIVSGIMAGLPATGNPEPAMQTIFTLLAALPSARLGLVDAENLTLSGVG